MRRPACEDHDDVDGRVRGLVVDALEHDREACPERLREESAELVSRLRMPHDLPRPHLDRRHVRLQARRPRRGRHQRYFRVHLDPNGPNCRAVVGRSCPKVPLPLTLTLSPEAETEFPLTLTLSPDGERGFAPHPDPLP